MLNPSTADASKDDPTIRKCVGFCERWGFGLLIVCNLFAFRSTAPKGLLSAADPVGPDNGIWLHQEARAADRVVLAWGSHAGLKPLLSKQLEAIDRTLGRYSEKTFTLGRCKDGNPRHPLMLAYSTLPQSKVGACEGCGAPDAEFAPDPYQADVNDDHTPVWLCETCRSNRADDI
jgi:hypothetical protein